MDYPQTFYRDVGAVIELLAASKHHAQFELRSYLEIEIAPAFLNDQIKLYYEDDEPIGFVTWAKVSTDVIDKLSQTGRSIEAHEWACGEIVYVNDLVVKGRNLNRIVENLRNEIFWSESVVYAVRRTENGKVRKLCRFIDNSTRSVN
jgi:hemolysin-activating ACP:hemolysin acyltransferase